MNLQRTGTWRLLAAAIAMACTTPALAQDAMLGTLLEEPGSAGLGFLMRVESSPYKGADDRVDLLPLYLYEGERFFLRSNAAGVRLATQDDQGLELFVERRLEGYPEDETPEILEGLRTRNGEADLGARYYWKHQGHTWDLSVRQDISSTSKGSEVRAGYGYLWRGQRWDVQPVLSLEWRSSKLNDYYFGVEPYEATAERPAYAAGSGLDVTAGLYARYRFLQHWSLLGGVYATQQSSSVRNSPLVDDRVQWGALLGAAYDFGNGQVRWDDDTSPTYVKVFYGRDSADGCHMVKIMTFSCTDLNDVDPTDIWGVHVGRPFVSELNGWPLDLVGYVGVLRHDEKGHQPDSWQIDAYMKAFYYGFPWSHRVKTRIGFGFGLSYAERVPYAEVQSQARRERNTSKLLNYLDPSIDVSLGDIFGSRRWHDLYLGVGISHRSGIFGSAQMLGTVDGGSNYIYAYLEAAL
ncbi:MipA/OmpV family protein [Stenotrophomonas sp.]|uniref:MipA/OmpV family protein n=1 Tax=Stenotrophomonas sp. TaxID=69392 RepID=UPI0028AE070B|nr:MipA/OmpV family protein [Stenotrophomonas sp.]